MRIGEREEKGSSEKRAFFFPSKSAVEISSRSAFSLSSAGSVTATGTGREREKEGSERGTETKSIHRRRQAYRERQACRRRDGKVNDDEP